jgi:aspartyl-tRNA(Asn)/glutamyl-tRNA(Gln) amidotransferase subunit A
LRALGAHVDERTLPRHEQTVAAAVLTLCAEAFDVHRALLAEQWDAYGHDARLALLRGAFVDASDYLSAQRVRAAARRELVEVFDEVDAIVMPTATIGAPERSGFDQEMLAHVHTFYWSALDNPVVAVPAGFTAEQLPVGLQFVGRPHQDAAVLGLARAFQTATDYHARMPELAVA